MRYLLVAIAAALVGCGPIWMFPGGRLGGTESTAPVSDWAALDHCELIQLETRLAAPYSVNIWAAGIGPQLYPASGRGKDSPWVQHIDASATARVQACDTVYRMRARHVRDEREIERFLEAVARKYDWKREQALEYRDWVFRLDPV